MSLKPCRECGEEVSESATACPHCGEPYPVEGGVACREETGRQVLQALVIVGILAVLVYYFFLRN